MGTLRQIGSAVQDIRPYLLIVFAGAQTHPVGN